MEKTTQTLFDAMSTRWQQERAGGQMTLGGLIDALEAMPPGALVDGIVNPHSYRGYYEDLAFEPVAEKITAGSLLEMCRSAVGEAFTGYKGGSFVMERSTPVWVAEYGHCGEKLMSVEGGAIVTEEEGED